MTLSERDQVYVEHMLECINRVERFVGLDRNLFMQSELVQDAVVRNLQTLSESTAKGYRRKPRILRQILIGGQFPVFVMCLFMTTWGLILKLFGW